MLSKVFANNTLDGVNSHGVNRFPGFIHSVERGEVQKDAEPEMTTSNGLTENWNGNFGIGVYNATKAMDRAIELSKKSGIGCVSLYNTNHWMRGGTYGWQAANAGCIGICFTNTVAIMTPYGGIDPRLGNNPLVMAVPRPDGNLVLDMAIAQYSFGKMYSYELEGKQLPMPGGYDNEGHLTTDPHTIRKSMRSLPIGAWKGSGLALMLDVLLTALTGGNSTKRVTERGGDSGISQCFIAIHQSDYHAALLDEIIAFTKSAKTIDENGEIRYPGERTLSARNKNSKEGIPVNEEAWQRVLDLDK